MIFKPFVPFPYDPKFINVDSSNWSGNFTSKVIPSSSLSPFVPGSNALAASASALKGGSAKSNKNNMRVYNRMRHTHKKYTKGCKMCAIKYRRSMSKGRSMKRGKSMSRSMKRSMGRSMEKSMGRNMGKSMTRSMRGGNVGVRDWITGNSLNNTSYRTPFNLPATLSALANPVPFIRTSHEL
jgi:hypothetical protein